MHIPLRRALLAGAGIAGACAIAALVGVGPADAATAPAAVPAAAHATSARPHMVTPVTLTDKVTPALPGGVCQVPGIGDIGSLINLCSAGSSGVLGDLNNICEPSLPQPEQATGGIDAMIQPPDSPVGGKTLYDNYGVSGQFWAAHDMQCSDMTSLVGNNVAGMVFDAAKAMDRVTITVYQSAAGNNMLNWLSNSVDTLISALGNAIYFPYLAPVVLLGAIWLAWQGLVKKRATRAIEGTLWMVIAATAAICLIGKPAAFTGVGTSVSNGVTGVLNTAFAKLPNAGNSNCLPVAPGDQQSVTSYSFTSGNGMVDQNANELWSVLVCKPWLYGEFGTTNYAAPGSSSGQTVVNQYGRQLLWAQSIAVNEPATTAEISAKKSIYTGIANQLKANDPGVYPLFQGDQWTTRLEIAFAAIFAAVVAGSLILLVSLTLIVLKIGFLLLLVAGPFFLIIGTHPGFGRIIAIRWFEMIVGVLMKQVAIAITLSVLLYCYSLIMAQSDQALPWALKILMIALVTVTVFIYRKPFQHLFSAVGYGTIGSEGRADYYLREAGATARGAALGAIPGLRVARWARRNPVQAASTAAGAAAGGPAGVAAGAATVADVATGGGGESGAGAGAADGDGGTARRVAGTISAGSARARGLAESDQSNGRTAPPLDLPSRSGSGSAGNGSSGTSAWSRGAGRSNGGRSKPPSGGSAPPLSGSGSAPPLRGSRSGGSHSGGGRSGGSRSGGSGSGGNGSGGSGAGGSGSGGSGTAPTWPASGWSGVRQRPRSRQDPPPPAGE